MKKLNDRNAEAQLAAVVAEGKKTAADTAQSAASAETAAANANAAATNITTASSVNLAYDPFNRIALANGLSASRYPNSANMTVQASNANNPYSNPVISMTGTAVVVYTMAELGVKAGDTITAAMTVWHEQAKTGGVYLYMIFKDASGVTVGDTTAPYYSTDGMLRMTKTKTVPAGAVSVQIGQFRKTTTDTSPILLLRHAVFLGAIAFPTTAGAASQTDLNDARLALSNQITAQQVKSFTTVTSASQTNAVPALGALTSTSSGYAQGSGNTAWGRVITPPAGATFNIVEYYPEHTLPDGGKGQAVVRLGTAANSTVVARSADVDSSTWNAAALAAKPLLFLLPTPVTPDGSTPYTVFVHAYGAKFGYATMAAGGPVTAERWYMSSTSISDYSTAALGLASYVSVYLHLLYDASAKSERYAALKPEVVPTDPAVQRLAGVPDIILPRKLWAVRAAGEELNVYNANILPGRWNVLGSVDYSTGFGAANYGRQLEEAWRIRPADDPLAKPAAGSNFTLSVVLRDMTWTTVKSANVQVYVNDLSNQTAVRYLSIGDSNTYSGYYQPQVAGLGGVTVQGIRQLVTGGNYGEGRGGWVLSGTSNSYTQAGTTTGLDSPFMFPNGVTGPEYRGNTAFWKNVVTNGAAYDWAGFALASKEGGATVQYDASGYPLNPQAGWVVFDPTKAAGSQFQQYGGSAWAAMGTQPSGWTFDFGKYLARYAWAFTAGNPTHVSILLGTNDWFNKTSDLTDADFASWLATYQGVVDSIHAADANIRVAVLLPALYASQDGAGNREGSTYLAERVKRNFQQLSRALINFFDTDAKIAQKTWVVPFGAMIDPVYGWEFAAAEAPNKYVTDGTTLKRHTNGVHYTILGGKQAGDSVKGWVQATR